MNVILGIEERQRQKQIRYERRLLRELSVESIKRMIQEHFGQDRESALLFSDTLEEGCLDAAIEAYLLGGRFSRFFYYGETEQMVRRRSQAEEKIVVDTLFNFILYWGRMYDYDLDNDGLYYRCSGFVEDWWKQGFQAGARAYKLRLH